jgi:hypothetical protein
MLASFQTRRRVLSCYSLLLIAALSAVCFAQSRTEPLVVVQNGKYGYIDHSGRMTIQPQFIWAEDFWRGLGSVYVCGRYVSIDASGALLPPRITVEGHLEPRKKGEKFGFVDAAGEFKIAPTFDEALSFSEGLAAVRVGEKWGFVDISGQMKISPRFKDAFYFREGVGTVELDSESGFVLVDTMGKVLATNLDYVDFIADERVPVKRGEKSGYLDLRGKVAVPLVYDGVRAFSDGMAAVEIGGKWGYVNRDGEAVIPPKFDDAGQFANGLAPAKLGDRTGFISKSGGFAFSLAFDYAPGFLTGDEESDLFVAPTDVSRFWTTDRKFGYVSTSGRVIWGPTDGSPDHPPLLGWSEEDKIRSCDGVTERTKKAIAEFPQD